MMYILIDLSHVQLDYRLIDTSFVSFKSFWEQSIAMI